MTPFEAVFGQKPDLWDVCEWGEKVWVHIEKGNKLGGCVCKGCWVGIDNRTTNGFRIYWPDTRTVTVERNIHFDKTQASVERLKGENWEFVKPSPDAPPDSAPGPSSSKTDPPSTVPVPTPTNPPAPPPKDEHCPTCDCCPSQCIQAIINGHGVASARPSNPVLPQGVQLPTMAEDAPLEGEGTVDWMMSVDYVKEYAMTAEISEAKALELRLLAEAKHRPDWPLWEKAIHKELALLKEAGTWSLVNPPTNANIVGSKWVFRTKKDAAGNVVQYKARLIAQGFSQVPGVN
jgi:hypothetical protein